MVWTSTDAVTEEVPSVWLHAGAGAPEGAAGPGRVKALGTGLGPVLCVSPCFVGHRLLRLPGV